MLNRLIPCLVVVVALLSLGCNDEEFCQDFDIPVAEACMESSECGSVSCEEVCGSEVSGATGGPFCADEVCVCPCRACADVPGF